MSKMLQEENKIQMIETNNITIKIKNPKLIIPILQNNDKNSECLIFYLGDILITTKMDKN